MPEQIRLSLSVGLNLVVTMPETILSAQQQPREPVPSFLVPSPLLQMGRLPL